MTPHLAVASADGSGRLRVARLDLAFAAPAMFWPHDWGTGWLVLGLDALPTEIPVPAALLPPAVPLRGSRLVLPTVWCRLLDAEHQQILAACDGQQLWLVNADRAVDCLADGLASSAALTGPAGEEHDHARP
jgi:hypothetical protein